MTRRVMRTQAKFLNDPTCYNRNAAMQNVLRMPTIELAGDVERVEQKDSKKYIETGD
jgi:hypothetical protein